MGLDICHVTLCAKTNEAIDCFTMEEFQSNPYFIERYKHLVTHNTFGDKVLYYTEKGHHRKQVAENFINEFENGKLYFRLAEVQKAKKFLQASPGETQADIENDFQKNFIDNFIEGESIFFISY